jgi:hypothetical protein
MLAPAGEILIPQTSGSQQAGCLPATMTLTYCLVRRQRPATDSSVLVSARGTPRMICTSPCPPTMPWPGATLSGVCWGAVTAMA